MKRLIMLAALPALLLAGCAAQPAASGTETLTVTGIAVCVVGALLPYSSLADEFGFRPLPGAYWLFLVPILAAYMALTQLVKSALARRFGAL